MLDPVDLREKLAARLAATSPRMDFANQMMHPSPTFDSHADWLRVADECIRQMEWARTGWIASKGSNGSTFYTNANPPIPLTPAPDDWRPQ